MFSPLASGLMVILVSLLSLYSCLPECFCELALRTCEALPLGWGLFIVFWDHSGGDTSCFEMRETILLFRLYVRIRDKVTPHYMHLMTKVLE